MLVSRDPEPLTLTEYAYKLIRRITDAHSITGQRLQAMANKYNNVNEQLGKCREFQVGDKVRYWTAVPQNADPSSRKLLMNWQGPHTVIEKIGPVNYRIESKTTTGRKGREVISQRVVHVRRLKPFNSAAVEENYEHDLTAKEIGLQASQQEELMDNHSNSLVEVQNELLTHSNSELTDSSAEKSKTSTSTDPNLPPNFQLIAELHDEICFTCQCTGSLQMCARCPRAYHTKCLEFFLYPARKLTAADVRKMRGWNCKDFGLHCETLRNPMKAQFYHKTRKGKLNYTDNNDYDF
jgi:hypothetical protein